MEGTNRSGIQCLQHPRQQITNFCIHYECLKPLCPDCVETHTKFHQKQDIQSWKHCVNKNALAVKSTLDQLRSIYQHQNQYKNVKSIQTIENDNIKRLSQIRDKYHQLIDQVFTSHQNAVRTHIRSHYKIDQPDTTKLRMAIEETQKILMKFGHSNTVVPALKKSILLDHSSLVDYFSHMKSHQKRSVIENFVLEENISFTHLRNNLESAITLLKPQEHYFQKEHAIQYSSPEHHRYQNNISQLPNNKNPFQPLKITIKDYFKSDSKQKLLHFFVPVSNQLKILKIQEAETKNWKSISFKFKGELPCYFKSIITPSGDIYLTGGSEDDRRCKQIYKYSFEKNSLDFVANMLNERSSHSICYLNNQIYLIGGFSQAEGQVTRECEVFNIQTQTCSKISPLNTPSANSCATAFNDQFIFKFGGIFNKMQGNSLIQMYSIKNNRWIVVNIETPKNIPNLELLSFSAAAQINQNDILVFGGYDNSEIQKPERICYALAVDIDNNTVQVKNYNTTPLAYAEGFWNNNPLIHKGYIYALQNITDQQDQLTAIADQRRVIVFTGARWL